MGLETVEIVLEIEERFEIELSDVECSRVRTVGDLAMLVIGRIPRLNDTCPTSRSFYRIRRLLMEQSGMERKEIRPTTRLRALFPMHFREHWQTLTALEPAIPSLQPSRRLDELMLLLSAAMVLATVPVVSICWMKPGPIAGLLAAATCCGIIAILALVPNRVGLGLPSGMQTVGDLARACTPLPLPATISPGAQASREAVLHEVRRITAEQLGLPLEKVHASSDFVRDLGC